jgi:N-acetylglucosaminyl-diphospho-decaprenol L-rhamnosyltransferase
VRGLIAWSYLVRMLAALVLPGHDWRRYRRDVTAALWPSRGEGLSGGGAGAQRPHAQPPG